MSRNDDTMVTMELVINTSENFASRSCQVVSVLSSGLDGFFAFITCFKWKVQLLNEQRLTLQQKVCRTISGPYKTSALPESLWCWSSHWEPTRIPRSLTCGKQISNKVGVSRLSLYWLISSVSDTLRYRKEYNRNTLHQVSFFSLLFREREIMIRFKSFAHPLHLSKIRF